MKDASFDIYSSVTGIRDPQEALDTIIEKLAEFKIDVPSELLRDHMAKLRKQIEAKGKPN